MKIAVNTRLLLPGKLEGIGWFTLESLKRITQQHPEHEFIFFFDRPFSQEFIFSSNIHPLVVPPQARHPFLYYLWFEHAVTRKLNQLKPDLFLSPDGYLSLSSKVKSLPVIHDLNFEHYPADLPRLTCKYYRHYFPRYARKATRIATVSEFSKKDISELYGIDGNKIDVVYNGVNESFKPVNDITKTQTKQQFSEGCDYFVFVGALHPRKNIANLFRAFDAFKKSQSSPVKLLIVGQKKWWTEAISAAYEEMDHKHEVVFTGRLQPETLKDVIASALALTYVSYFEGFGIPILEGMACDVPVITSNVTSMPEVGGNAAIYADPFSVDSIADAMQKIASDPQLRQSLIEAGRERRLQFTWQKTAENLWTSIEKTLDNA